MQYNTLVFQLHYLSDAYNVHFLLKPCQDDAASTERVLSGIKLDCDHFQSIHVLLSSRHTHSGGKVKHNSSSSFSLQMNILLYSGVGYLNNNNKNNNKIIPELIGLQSQTRIDPFAPLKLSGAFEIVVFLAQAPPSSILLVITFICFIYDTSPREE